MSLKVVAVVVVVVVVFVFVLVLVIHYKFVLNLTKSYKGAVQPSSNKFSAYKRI